MIHGFILTNNILILLPAYNEEVSIDPLFDKLHKYFSESERNFKVVVCDDGGKDSTVTKLNQYIDKFDLKIIKHKINRGLGETMRDLLEYAVENSEDDDIFIRMDCDDTHEPQYIESLINKVEDGFDVVIASRFEKGGDQKGLSFYRKFISMGANRFMKFFFPIKGLKEYSCGFRAYRANIIKRAIGVYGNQFQQLKGLGFTGTLEKVVKLKLLGAKFGEIPFVLKYDQKQSPSKMVSSITTLGYFVLALLYWWPFGGWRKQFKYLKNYNQKRWPDDFEL